MRIPNAIYATSSALRKFLVARAKGASPELMTKLGAEAMAEQATERAKAERRPRLAVSNENPMPDLAG
jgi:hypothetical protein